MSEFSTSLPSGLAIIDGKNIVRVPLAIEAAEGTKAERKALIEGFVADIQAKGPDIALVRAGARAERQDPAAAESAFTAAQLLGAPVVAAQPGGTI